MLRRLCILLLTACIGASSLPAAPRQTSSKAEINSPSTSSQPTFHTLDDYVGTTDTAGTTWYDYQHSGSCGKMIDVDAAGMVSVAWMNALDEALVNRYVYANSWDPTTEDFMFDTIGVWIDHSQRAGYICQTLIRDALPAFAFHQITTGSDSRAAVALGDVISEPEQCYGPYLEIIWPKIGADINANLHLISTENPRDANPDAPRRIYYSRGVPEFDPEGFPLDIVWDEFVCGNFELWDTVMVISADVACSRHSERCAIAWCHSMDDLSDNPSLYNNEIYMRISEDGGLNWDEPINVTQWTPWDPDCYHSGGDPLVCDRDTFRCYTDLSILLDENDYIHLAFTTIGFWWYLPDQSDSGFVDPTRSMIYHWCEGTGYYRLVANGWFDGYQPGAWQRNVQRPSLAVDPQTEYVYCSYMQYDTTTYNWAGFPMADAFVTVSTNGGIHWAVGTNVTNTTPDVTPVPAGQSMHERDVTVAPLVSGGFLHMEYVVDNDAGSVEHGEGTWSLNRVIYQQIPVDQIAVLPLLEDYPMHCRDSLGTSRTSSGVPAHLLLHQNYPNPFNPATMIQFDLTQRATVTLRIYNILGQQVTTLLDHIPLAPGAHKLAFDASSYPSGVYICQLTAPGFSAARKMLLLK